MARIEKTVFISYRRTDVYTALAVYENLKNQGYDVFFDYRSISSGDFEQIITSNIRARAHFLLILTPTALDRASEPGDWLRREIEFAIDEKRNIIPLFFRGFQFGDPSVTEKLTGKLRNVSRYNGLNVHEDYFDEAMQRLRTQFLNIPLNTVLHPVSTEVRKVVRDEQIAADEALGKIESVKELVKDAERKPNLTIAEPYSKQTLSTPHNMENSPPQNSRFKIGLIGGIAGGLLILGLLIWGASKLLLNPSILPTETPIVSAPTFAVGSTKLSDKDGMTLLYIPDAEFMMGSKNGSSNEEPAQKVKVSAFWIDKTEVTVRMYYLCVWAADICKAPIDSSSYTHPQYYSNHEFDTYPMVNITWYMAKTYCEWAGRRLSTEAEWELAARGKMALIYPWGNSAPTNDLLNYNNVIGDTTEVNKYENGKSPYDVLNMAGNVSEWVSSLYQPYPYSESDGRENLASPGERVVRGGSFNGNSFIVRSSFRSFLDRSKHTPFVGFRCAMDATP